MLRNFLSNVQDQNGLRLAVIGDLSDVVAVPGSDHRVYAQLGGIGGTVIEVHTSSPRTLAAGDSVWVMRQNPLNAAGWRMVFWLGRKPAVSYLLDSDVVILADSDGELLVQP